MESGAVTLSNTDLVSGGVFADDTPPMQHTNLNIAFLSTDGLEDRVVDDDLAVAPLRALNVRVQRCSWHDQSIDWGAFDLVVVRSTWDYHQHCADFFAALQRIDQSGTHLLNPLSVLRWNSRKTYLRDLREQGIEVVPTSFGDALDEAAVDQLVATYGAGNWIIKPDIGASAGGIVRIDGAPDEALRQALLRQFAETGYLAQAFVDAVTATGEYSVFFFDGVFSHCILKSPKDGDFRVQEEHGGHIRAVAMPDAVASAARRVYDVLPARCLYVRVDLVANAAGRFEVMEVELIEPSLYLRTHPDAADNFARAVRNWHDRRSAKLNP